MQVAATCRSESDDMLSFVLGASSCGASLECLLEGEHFSSSFGVELDKDQTITGSRVRGPYAHLTSASHLVRRACTGDTTALAHVETHPQDCSDAYGPEHIKISESFSCCSGMLCNSGENLRQASAGQSMTASEAVWWFAFVCSSQSSAR